MTDGTATPMDLGCVLAVDDEPEVLATLQRQLRREFKVHTATDAASALALLDETDVHVVVSDQRMPEVSGAAFLTEVSARHPKTVRLLLTGYADLGAMIDAVNSCGIYRYLAKPWDADELRRVIRDAYQLNQQATENEHLLQRANSELERRVEARTRQLAESEQRYRIIVENTNDAVVLLDAEGRIQTVNPAFIRLTGYGGDEANGRRLDELLVSGREPPGLFERIEAALRDDDVWREALWNRRKDGSVFVKRVSVSCARNTGGRPTHYVGVFTDLASGDEELEEVWSQAQFDPLTGLPNRLVMMDRLHGAIALAERRDTKVAVVFLDLDGFKQINDNHGHLVGDLLLQAVADRLRKRLRKIDTISRLGGDEFVVVITEVDGRARVSALIDELRVLLARPVATENGRIAVEVSAGFALYPDDASDAHQLLGQADAGMYADKAARRKASG